MRVSTPVASDTAVLTTTTGVPSNSLNSHGSGAGSVPNYAGKNGVPQVRTVSPATQQQTISNNWTNSTEGFGAQQGSVNTNQIGNIQVAYAKSKVTTTMANANVTKQLTTLTTVSKVPQVGVQPVTGVKQTVQITPAPSVRLTQPGNVQLTTPGLAVPPGMILARNQNGQLLLVNSNSLASSATSTSTVLVTQSSTSGATTTLKNSTQAGMAVTQTAITSATPAPGQVVARTVVPVSSSITVKTLPVKQTVALHKVPSTSQAATTQQASQPAISLTQEDVLNVTKCRNFLTTLIQLASNGGQSAETVSNVKKLVQNLIDDKIDPDNFTQQLQVELNSAPQPYLGPFLKKSLPLLRLTMMQQSRGGGAVPPAIAVAAIKASSNNASSTSPTVNQNMPKVVTVHKRPPMKPKNSVPEIRLPRVSPSPGALQYQTLTGIANSHVSVCRAASSSMPPPAPLTSSPRIGSQKWASPGGTAGSGGGTFKDDDDINDVASMAGVNLSEESARILATNSDLVGSQIRSCKDTTVVNSKVLTRKLSEIVSKHPHVKQLHPDVINFAAHAIETRVKDLIEKVSLVAFHRIANYKDNEHYEAAQDVKSQLKFLLELDVLEKKRHAQSEREVLMKAMKSRSKNEDPEQQRLKQKAKEMQQLEMERLQIRNADETARNAIGPRKKKPKYDTTVTSGESKDFSSPFRSTPSRPRIKRVNAKDLVFVLEQEKDTNKSKILYKSYLK